jgi:hypothetical protein
MELMTVEHQYELPGWYLVAANVINIFGNDKTALVLVIVGKAIQVPASFAWTWPRALKGTKR